ncbi:MAG TPA: alpha/beta fold hydrolase [Bacteroidales bacterium]|nr:alpha/beta fold hydrolase [Bacteroidales bacterium]
MKQFKCLNNRSILTVLFVFSVFCSCNSPESSLLIYEKENNEKARVKNENDLEIKRNQILDSMQAVMGAIPARIKKCSYLALDDTIYTGVKRIRITYSTRDSDTVPAYLFIPEYLEKKVPGILCLHQTTPIGKDEPAGLGGSENLHYAYELALKGYVTIAPDYPNFGEYKFDPYSAGYQSATMKGVINHMQAVDILQSVEQVDPERIGCIGHSLGGHNSLFVAAFDTRISAVVTSCGFTSFRKYYNGDLTGWSHKGYMPKIATVYSKDPSKMPFDFPEVLAAIAPRAVFINAPVNDSNFDNSGVKDCVKEAGLIYKLAGKSKDLVLMTPDSKHDFPREIRIEAYKFLDSRLRREKD